MKFLANTSWSEAATAAVACISAAAVWATFWTGHRERMRVRRLQQLVALEPLRKELERTSIWASRTYNDESHSAEWYDPSWHVIPFSAEHAEEFNRLTLSGEYPAELEDGVVELERAARAFHRALAALEAEVYRPPNLSWWTPVVEASQRLGRALTAQDFDSVERDYAEADRERVMSLYERNRDLHVRFIGGDGDGALHDAWRTVDERLQHSRDRLRDDDDPWWRWAGHAAAVVFVLVGFLFLLDFGVTLASRAWERLSSRPTQSGMTTTAPVRDTTHGR